MKKLRRQQGFTLIEVLTVILVISILAAAIYSGFDESRDNAKNQALHLSVKETQLALEVFKAQNGRFPISDDFEALLGDLTLSSVNCVPGTEGGNETWQSDTECQLGFIPGLSPFYIKDEPSVELSANDSCEIQYTVAADGSWYELTATDCLAGSDDIITVSSLGGSNNQ